MGDWWIPVTLLLSPLVGVAAGVCSTAFESGLSLREEWRQNPELHGFAFWFAGGGLVLGSMGVILVGFLHAMQMLLP